MLTELNETSGSKVMWAKISNGMIVINSDESDPKAKSRVNKLGNTVYERFYKSIYGIITTITVEVNKFNETEVRVGLKHNDNSAVLSFNLDSSYGRGFLHQIFNVDLSRGVEFSPWQKVTEDGTKRSNLYLNYNKTEKVAYALPEGCPEVKWVQTKKGNVIDPVSKAEHDDFLDTRLNEFIQKNGLVYQKVESVLETLTDEEKKQLKAPKAEKVVTNAPIHEASGDDFFDNL